MHAAHEFLKTLAIVLGVAAITTVVFQRLRQPVVLGYVIAGLLVGPHLPLPLGADPETVNTLSELGVILLMFAIGLELNVAKLVRVVPTAGVIAVIQVALMIVAGYVVGRAFGWTTLESVFAGSAIAISSTTIIAKVFDELGVEPRLRELVYGVLVVEDILAILILATMTPVASGAGLDAMTFLVTTGKLVAFLAVMIVSGLLVVPPLMRFVVRLGRPETTVVASIGLCFGLAHACAAAHYSVALGAFVAGMLVSESGEGHTVEHLIVPVRDMFAAIFFVSVGMLIDPQLVADNAMAVVVLSVVVIVGKIVSVALGAVVTGAGVRTSVRAGVSLSQIGEFSFIIVGLGLSLNATRPFLFPVAVAVSAITTLTTPALIRRSERIADVVEARLPRRITGFIGQYDAWLERARTAPSSPTKGARWRRLVVLLVADAGALVGLLVGAAALHARVERFVAERWAMPSVLSQALVWAGAALLVLPFVFGVVRLTRALALMLVGAPGASTGMEETDGSQVTSGARETSGPQVTSGARETSGERKDAARAIALVVQLGLVTAVAMAAIAVVEPFVPPVTGVVLLAALFVAVSIAFWRNAEQFDVDVKAGVSVVRERLQARARENSMAESSTRERDKSSKSSA